MAAVPAGNIDNGEKLFKGMWCSGHGTPEASSAQLQDLLISLFSCRPLCSMPHCQQGSSQGGISALGRASGGLLSPF